MYCDCLLTAGGEPIEISIWAAPGEAVAFGFDLETGQEDGALLEAGQYRVGKTVWPAQTEGEGIPIYLEFRITKAGEFALLEDSGQENFMAWLKERYGTNKQEAAPMAMLVYTEKMEDYEIRDGVLVLRDVGWDKTNALMWVTWNRSSQWSMHLAAGARIQVYGGDGWEEAWNRMDLNDVSYVISPGGMFQDTAALCDPDFSENGALPPGRYRLCKEVYGTKGNLDMEKSESFPVYMEFVIE